MQMWPNVEGGLLFRITKGSPRYSLKKLKADGLIDDTKNPLATISGKEALDILTACMVQYGDSSECFDAHPDTGIQFEGYKLSFVDRLIPTAKRLHEMTANIGMVSWDFTVDENNDIVVVEVNLRGQAVWLSQMLSGEPFYGENTKKMLQSIRR